MSTLLLTLLILSAGVAFAWYRIKTRGIETFMEESRRFIALQNSKDVMAFKATKRFILLLWGRSSEQARHLYDQYQEKEKERMANREREEKERAAYLTKAKEFFGEPKAGSVTNGYLRNIAPEVERLVSGLTPEQKRLLGELTPEDKKHFQGMCRHHGYPDGDLEYAFVEALEEVDFRRYRRLKPDDPRRADRYRYELSIAFDTAGWKSRLEAAGCARSAFVNSLHRSQEIHARAQARARQTQRNREEHWVNRNASPNTPQWLKDLNVGVWNIALYYALGGIAGVVLLILFIISVNMG